MNCSDRVINAVVLTITQLLSLYALLQKRRHYRFRYAHRMPDRRIPIVLLYGEFASGKRARERHHLRFTDVCKRDKKAMNIDIDRLEDVANDRTRWRRDLHRGLERGEEKQRL